MKDTDTFFTLVFADNVHSDICWCCQITLAGRGLIPKLIPALDSRNQPGSMGCWDFVEILGGGSWGMLMHTLGSSQCTVKSELSDLSGGEEPVQLCKTEGKVQLQATEELSHAKGMSSPMPAGCLWPETKL